jgi:hypothetical protein
MFNPGGFLTGVQLPWVILAPVLPLLIILVRRIFFDPAIISLILLCTTSILVNLFIFLIRDHAEYTQLFLNFSLIIEFIFASFLLRTCAFNSLLKSAIVAGMLVFPGVFLALGIPGDFKDYNPFLGKACFVSLFVFSFLVLVSQFRYTNYQLTESHVFWISGGLFVHCGLVSLLLFLHGDSENSRISSFSDFNTLYTIITLIKFIFFAIGLLVYKKLDFR